VPNGEQLKQVAKLLEAKTIRPLVGHVFEFSEKGLQAAHELSETHHAKGKIVIKIK
jgi:NADPH:quinone reductase-like Zn-dependent oxidoreductase